MTTQSAPSTAAIIHTAIEIMDRRGWGMIRLETGRWVLEDHNRKGWLYIAGRNWFANTVLDAMAAIVEADRCVQSKEERRCKT